MSLSQIGLLLSFISEGIAAIKKFITDEEVRTAFKGLQESTSDAEKQAVAQKIAALIYKS